MGAGMNIHPLTENNRQLFRKLRHLTLAQRGRRLPRLQGDQPVGFLRQVRRPHRPPVRPQRVEAFSRRVEVANRQPFGRPARERGVLLELLLVNLPQRLLFRADLLLGGRLLRIDHPHVLDSERLRRANDGAVVVRVGA